MAGPFALQVSKAYIILRKAPSGGSIFQITSNTLRHGPHGPHPACFKRRPVASQRPLSNPDFPFQPRHLPRPGQSPLFLFSTIAQISNPARAAVLAHVAEYHRPHVHRRAQKTRDTIQIAIPNRPRTVPRTEYRVDCIGQQLPPMAALPLRDNRVNPRPYGLYARPLRRRRGFFLPRFAELMHFRC